MHCRLQQMLTTPPLIYALAALGGFCGRERYFNSALVPLAIVALARLRRRWTPTGADRGEALATALAIFTLPVLAGTSSLLFYTDLLSLTLVVLGLGTRSPTAAAGVFALAVLSRQTNIVWAAFHCAVALAANFDARDAIRSTARCVAAHAAFGVLGAAFVAFVASNGALVLGDAQAHRLHFHAPQLLYFTLFTAVSAAPSLIAHARPALRHLRTHALAYAAACVVLVPLVARFTYAHPYLLADNRHFTFYIWRRWFDRHELLRFATIPLYAAAAAPLAVATRAVPPLVRLAGVACAAACLVPAHLVEFRYFITPYALLRLHFAPVSRWQLAAEIAVHAAVNAAALYLFFNKPFVWPHEPHSLQRFMW